MKRSSRMKMTALATAVSGALFVNAVAQADVPSLGVLSLGVLSSLPQVSDHHLADMRGRYVGPNQVVYFGVQMETQWQTRGGKTITSTANFGLPASGGVTSSVSACVDNQCGSQSNGHQSFSLPASAGGLKNANGVIQSIQVAANKNSVNNSITMNVTSASDVKTDDGKGGFLLDGTGTSATQNSGGTVVAAGVGAHGMGVSINVLNGGQIVQQISDGNIVQSALVQSDMNLIQNSITLTVGMQAGSGVGASGVGTALQSLQGLPRMGGL
ncbi:MAG: hypothetical protein KGJ12_08280 [Gammaproteobacteria bacterium]|nr:hypothetical protein [Gammaproteobacteria bacterium]